MGINWFEGGRRIATVVGGLMLLAATLYVILNEGDRTVVLETASPDERPHWTLKGCRYPDQEKSWPESVSFGADDARPVAICLRAEKDGRITYGYGPEREIPFPVKPGEKPLPPLKVREILEADAYSDPVEAYASARMAAFRFTPEETAAIADSDWEIALYQFCDRVVSSFPWVAGGAFGLWAVTAALGWLVRGFAGIQNGRDFRAEKDGAARAPGRAKLDWLMTAVGIWAVAAGGAWAVQRVMTPSASALGRTAGKIAGAAGNVVLFIIGFSLFCAGAFGLRALVYSVLNRPAPAKKADDRMFFLFGVLNVVLLAIPSWLLNSYTVVGSWTDAIDRWSRTNGQADAAMVGMFALFLPWPFLPLVLIDRVRRSLRTTGHTA